MSEKDNHKQKYIIIGVSVLAVLSLSGGVFLLNKTTKDMTQNTIELEDRVLNLEDENIILIRALQKEQQKNGIFQSQIGQITGTVGTLNKLAKLDKELLQKYSKVYFLNENYTPKKLIEIPLKYLYDKNKIIQINASTSPYLLKMMDDAEKINLKLLVISGFRSFSEQGSLKSNYKFVYGSGANQFSADQGYSEHQLGTTVDFTSLDLGANFVSFAKSPEYKWLLDNAYQYGFVLSYPTDNTFYQFEPWHFRFVGKQLAERLHEEKQNFYDLDQRKIDAYLVNIFD